MISTCGCVCVLFRSAFTEIANLNCVWYLSSLINFLYIDVVEGMFEHICFCSALACLKLTCEV